MLLLDLVRDLPCHLLVPGNRRRFGLASFPAHRDLSCAARAVGNNRFECLLTNVGDHEFEHRSAPALERCLSSAEGG